MKKPKRYTSEDQIIKKIDQCYNLHNKLLWQAEEQDRAGHKDIAFRFRKKAERLIEVRLKKLSVKLAEFRTAILPGIVEDESVAQKLN